MMETEDGLSVPPYSYVCSGWRREGQAWVSERRWLNSWTLTPYDPPTNQHARTLYYNRRAPVCLSVGLSAPSQTQKARRSLVHSTVVLITQSENNEKTSNICSPTDRATLPHTQSTISRCMHDRAAFRVYSPGDGICRYWQRFATQTDSCRLSAHTVRARTCTV